MILLANCWRLCPNSLVPRRLLRSDDALPAAQARPRFVLAGRCFHACLPLHVIGSRNLLRRNAIEPTDCAGDGGGAACPVRCRQASSRSLSILAEFRASRRDGILLRL